MAEPLLRSLSPALRRLEARLRAWLDAPHRFGVPVLLRAALDGLALDLHRQADALDVDRPLLTVMLMGGTGVGKSTLLNALAGGGIAQASFHRPTTREPVVYYHESVRPDRLDPALRHCRLAPHDREALAQKVIVDTPDLDSNDLANRDRLRGVLPVADVVLYVGSQEKYHDRLGWDLFKEQRQRRGFAFVLNKWDRCLHPGAGGLRPDEDLLRDLRDEGFERPLLFRTVAQAWLDAPGATPPDLPAGEQFAELRDWLELGLTRLEIEAIKAKGVSQLLRQIAEGLRQASPPDLAGPAERTAAAWAETLSDEAGEATATLVGTLEPYQDKVELYFSAEGYHRFKRLMGGYLNLMTSTRQAGTTLRDRIPFLPRPATKVDAGGSWDLKEFLRACSDAAGKRVLDGRMAALSNRLVTQADPAFPHGLLADETHRAAKLDWRERHREALADTLAEVERECRTPTGARRVAQTAVVTAANVLPELALFAGLALLCWRYFVVEGYRFQWIDVFMPFIVTLVVLVLTHLVVSVALPVRWPAIRGQFTRRLRGHLEDDLRSAFLGVPGLLASELRGERERAEALAGEVREVGDWLDRRQQAAHVTDLYGKESS